MCFNVNDCQVKLHGMEVLLQLESRLQSIDVASKYLDADSELSHELEQLILERVSHIPLILQSVLLNV
jgi:hypothetical protein